MATSRPSIGSSPSKNSALRDALVELMRRAGTELNADEAGVLVSALSAEITGRSVDRSASVTRLESLRSPAKSESSTSVISATSNVSHEPLLVGRSVSAHEDEVDGPGVAGGQSWHRDAVSALAQEAEVVYADDGYQSTSGIAGLGSGAGVGGKAAFDTWNGNEQWFEKHREAADVLASHPEIVDFVSELLSRQDELETALSKTEQELKKREQEHLQHVQYLEDLSLVQIEQANTKAEQATAAARKGAAMMSPEAAFQKLVQELNEKEKQLSQLRQQQDMLKVDMKERDYLHSQEHKSYAEEQQQLIQELTGMRRTLDDIRQRSMRRKKSSSGSRSVSALAEEFARLAADKTAEALALKEELRAMERSDADRSDLAQSDVLQHVQSQQRPVSRTSSVMDAYVSRNGPNADSDVIVFHPAPIASSTPDMDRFLNGDGDDGVDVVIDDDDEDDEDDIISKLTGAKYMRTASLDDLLAGKAPEAAEKQSVSSSASTQWAFQEPEMATAEATAPSAPSQAPPPPRPPPSMKRAFDPLRDERPASQGATSSPLDPLASGTRQTSRSAAAVTDAPFPSELRPRPARTRNTAVYVRSDSSEGSGGECPGDGGDSGRARHKVKRWMTLPANMGRLKATKLEWRKAGETPAGAGNLRSVYRTPAQAQDDSTSASSSGCNSRSSPAHPSSGAAGAADTDKLPKEPMRIFNVAILGDSGVGKTTFIHRFANHGKRHPHGIPPATIGVDYVVKNAIIANQTVTLKLWDTAGTERFHSLAQNYLRRCDGVILMFDISKRSTFEGIQKWQTGVMQTCREGATLMVVGNKVDLVEDGLATQAVTANEALELAHGINNGMYMESSGRRGIGVDEACSILTKAMLAKEDEDMQGLPQPNLISDGPVVRQGQCCKSS